MASALPACSPWAVPPQASKRFAMLLVTLYRDIELRNAPTLRSAGLLHLRLFTAHAALNRLFGMLLACYGYHGERRLQHKSVVLVRATRGSCLTWYCVSYHLRERYLESPALSLGCGYQRLVCYATWHPASIGGTQVCTTTVWELEVPRTILPRLRGPDGGGVPGCPPFPKPQPAPTRPCRANGPRHSLKLPVSTSHELGLLPTSLPMARCISTRELVSCIGL